MSQHVSFNNRTLLVAVALLGLLVVGATYQEDEKISTDQLILEEMKRTNVLLAEMNSNLSSIQKEINNSRNNISVKEHLEDIKDMLRNLD